MADSIRLCSIAGCEARHYARTYCKKHWTRWHSHGDPHYVSFAAPIPRAGACSVAGCTQKVRNQGLCAAHYRKRRAGRPVEPRPGIPESKPGEQWRPIPGTGNDYEVSNLGRVRSMPRIDRSGRQLAGRIMALSTHPSGYKYVALRYESKRRRRLVHQLVAEAFLGPRAFGLHVCHDDGDPSNNVLANLRYDTPSGNSHDTVRHGRHPWANKTHCPKGHAYSEFGVYREKYRRRECSRCRRG